jgi:hypothetical protein
MQLKCTYCSTPFALSNDQVAQAIEILRKDPHSHYDAHCPRCRRANKLPRKMFERYPQYRHMLEQPEPPAEPAHEPVAEQAPQAPPAEEAAAEPAAKPKAKGKKAG